MCFDFLCRVRNICELGSPLLDRLHGVDARISDVIKATRQRTPSIDLVSFDGDAIESMCLRIVGSYVDALTDQSLAKYLYGICKTEMVRKYYCIPVQIQA